MTRPFLIGLTGSIGMGKSTTATMFADEGVPVWDADAAVDRLYAVDGAAVEPLKRLRSELIVGGRVDRKALKDWIKKDSSALSFIEEVVHPLVAADRAEFVENSQADILVLDIPLLFELETQSDVDAVVVVTAPYEVQRERVLSRPGVTELQFENLLARQMPDAKKQTLADYVIETTTMDGAHKSVREILDDIRGKMVARDRP